NANGKILLRRNGARSVGEFEDGLRDRTLQPTRENEADAAAENQHKQADEQAAVAPLFQFIKIGLRQYRSHASALNHYRMKNFEMPFAELHGVSAQLRRH